MIWSAKTGVFLLMNLALQSTNCLNQSSFIDHMYSADSYKFNRYYRTLEDSCRHKTVPVVTSYCSMETGVRCVTCCKANCTSTLRCNSAIQRVHTAPSKPQ